MSFIRKVRFLVLTAFIISCFSVQLPAKTVKSKKTSKSKISKVDVKSQKEAENPSSLIIKHKLIENGEGQAVFSSKTFENSVGAVKLLLKGSVGSFQLYALNEENFPIPLLSGNDEFTSSFFSLRVGRNEYRLTDSSGVIVGARKTKTGGEMIYSVPAIARVVVSLDVIQSAQKRDPDVIKVTIEILNRSSRFNSFSVKQVLDTVLGEKLGPHFSTAEDFALNSEMQVRRFDRIKYIQSTSPKASMAILVHGADVTKPEVVSVGNKDLLALPSWIPQIVRSRTFDSVLSYNNSAVCINWEPLELAPDETGKNVYYIMTSTGDKKIDTEAFIRYLEKNLKSEKNKKDVEVKADNIKQKEDKVEQQPSFNDISDNNVSDDGNIPDDEVEDKVIEIKDDFDEKEENVPFSVDRIPPEKLDPLYVQSLLDRIDALESDPEIVDKQEVLQLNAELDAIMNKLRQ